MDADIMTSLNILLIDGDISSNYLCIIIICWMAVIHIHTHNGATMLICINRYLL